MMNEECAAIHWQPYHGLPPGFENRPVKSECVLHAEDLVATWQDHGIKFSAGDLIERLEDDGFENDDDIRDAMDAVGLRYSRVYQHVVISPLRG